MGRVMGRYASFKSTIAAIRADSGSGNSAERADSRLHRKVRSVTALTAMGIPPLDQGQFYRIKVIGPWGLLLVEIRTAGRLGSRLVADGFVRLADYPTGAEAVCSAARRAHAKRRRQLAHHENLAYIYAQRGDHW